MPVAREGLARWKAHEVVALNARCDVRTAPCCRCATAFGGLQNTVSVPGQNGKGAEANLDALIHLLLN